MKEIRVLVVDDSAFSRHTLTTILEMDKEIKIIGTASNGQEAIEMTKKLLPDVITLDILMPVMDGLTALKHIMREVPTPVIMVSSLTTHEGAQQTMEALSLGAIDYVSKSSGPISLDIAKIKGNLIEKVKIASAAKIKLAANVNVASEKFRKIISDLLRQKVIIPGTPTVQKKKTTKELVAIAASTGGPAALQIVLGSLPATFPVGLVIVQHIAEGFSDALAERLNSISPLEIKVSADYELIRPGVGLLAPAGYHLTVKRIEGKIYSSISREPSNTLHRPSADVLFSSVAKTCGAHTCAVIMTGMGGDGAHGIKEIREKGGTTIAQDEYTSVIFGMPNEAIQQGGIDIVAPLENIPGEIIKAI